MRTWIEIDQQALLHNLEQFLLLAPASRIMCVVKSNAYGHGLREIASILQHASPYTHHRLWFGVDSIDEAVALREQGITLPVLTLGYVPLDRLAEAVARDIRLTVYNPETLQSLSNLKLQNLSSAIRVHVKVDTGASRQGILPQQLLDFIRAIPPGVELEGLCTHFANIEDTTDHSYARLQLERFQKAIADLEAAGISVPIKHTACSAAAVLFPETHFDMVRLGISLYGIWSSKETLVSAGSRSDNFTLRPVLSWKTRVAQLKTIPAGTPVSYGLTERVSRESRMAVIPVGYFDGFDRRLSSIGNVLIRGKRAKIVGRVCMNMMMADVTDIPEAALEDEVIFIGKQGNEQISADEVAQKSGTIAYELLARLNPLLPRIVV